MYQPPLFKEEREDVLHDLIRSHSFGTLVTLENGEINANHLPFFLRDNNTLCAHISKGNPLWKTIKETDNILVIFQGPHHYISPNWYPSKQEHHKEVPTWNYFVVHAYGNLKIIEDPDWIRHHLDELTDQNEKIEDVPWKVSDAPEKFVAQQINGIVGIEIEITKLEGKCKAGQNKKQPELCGVVNALEKLDSTDAQKMSKIINNLVK